MKKISLFTVLISVFFASCAMNSSKTEYKVVHLQQNIEDDGYTVKDTEILSGSEGQSTNAVSKEYAGFSVQSFQQGKVGDVDEIQIKYDRIPVTFKINPANGTGEKSITKKYGTSVDSLVLANLINADSTFSFWFPSLPEKFEKDGVYTANWNYISYKVQYLFQDAEGDGYSEMEEYPVKICYGRPDEKTEVTAAEVDGYISQKISQITLQDEGETVKVYYNRKLVTLLIDLDGGSGNCFVKGRFGAPVKESLFGDFSKVGYTFGGLDKQLPETFNFADDFTNIGKVVWVPEGDARYRVYCYLQDVYGDSYVLDKTYSYISSGPVGAITDVHSDGSGTFKHNGTEFVYEGFHFSQKEDGSDNIENVEIKGDETSFAKIYFDRNISTVTLKLGFTPEEGSGDSADDIVIQGRYGQKVIIPDSIKRKGYTIGSWWGFVEYYPSKVSNLVFNAKWNPITYNLIFHLYDETGPSIRFPEYSRTVQYGSEAYFEKYENTSDWVKDMSKTNSSYMKMWHEFEGFWDNPEYEGEPVTSVKNLFSTQGETAHYYSKWTRWTPAKMNNVEITSVSGNKVSYTIKWPDPEPENINNYFPERSGGFWNGSLYKSIYAQIYLDGEFVENYQFYWFDDNSERTSSSYFNVSEGLLSDHLYTVTAKTALAYNKRNSTEIDGYIESEPVSYTFMIVDGKIIHEK